jgi:hypothetical protein
MLNQIELFLIKIQKCIAIYDYLIK